MNKLLLSLIILIVLLINLINCYKLERLNEEKGDEDGWEAIEEEKENVFKPIIVDRRELLYFRINRKGNTESSSSTESVSIKFEIKSKDIQETFFIFGINNETSIKSDTTKSKVEQTTPIRIEQCLDPIKPLYFTLSMFNYLWGGDLIFTIEENHPNYCINSLPKNTSE